MTSPEAKKALRRELLARRLAIPEEERVRAAEAVCRRLHELLGEPRGIVMAYAPAKGEVDPMPYVRALWSRGLPVAFPAVREGRIVPKLAKGEAELAPGAFGILEPLDASPEVHPDEIAAVLVPGLAYDLQGFRLGYGGGYYDRFLPALGPGAATIGLVYDALLLCRLPREPHDVPVRWVVTEARRLGPFGDGGIGSDG